jgi:CheY-like chemotaxis protein
MKSVLIADDDRILRKVVVRAMEKASDQLRVLEAEDGQAAIDILNSENVDLVVTDINMPRVSGLMLIAYMNAFFPGVPCFVMTSYGTSRMKSKLPHDLLKFYNKPIDAHELTIAAVAVLEEEQSPGEGQTVSLANFLDMVILEELTCTVTVEPEGMDPCHLFIDNGVLIDATKGERHGEAVAVEVISRPNVNFSMEHGCPETIQKRINRSFGELIEKSAGS